MPQKDRKEYKENIFLEQMKNEKEMLKKIYSIIEITLESQYQNAIEKTENKLRTL